MVPACSSFSEWCMRCMLDDEKKVYISTAKTNNWRQYYSHQQSPHQQQSPHNQQQSPYNQQQSPYNQQQQQSPADSRNDYRLQQGVCIFIITCHILLLAHYEANRRQNFRGKPHWIFFYNNSVYSRLVSPSPPDQIIPGLKMLGVWPNYCFQHLD